MRPKRSLRREKPPSAVVSPYALRLPISPLSGALPFSDVGSRVGPQIGKAAILGFRMLRSSSYRLNPKPGVAYRASTRPKLSRLSYRFADHVAGYI